MILAAVFEAREAGARMCLCAEVAGVDARTLQRWASHPTGEDRRWGPTSAPHNRPTDAEREQVLKLLTSPEYRDLSPKPARTRCGAGTSRT